MSRVAKDPITIPGGVDVVIKGQHVAVKGPKGALDFNLHDTVEIVQNDNELTFQMRKQTVVGHRSKESRNVTTAMAGTSRAVVNNMVVGVSDGFEKKLILKGVGYRALVKGKKLDLTLGFSHPILYDIPEGITIETPSATEVNVKGIDKQLVGQVAAEIRAFRPPEPYKGKGVRYADEVIVIKETKK